MQLDESAILWSAPERERAGRPLIVLLHGYGSHEGDLFSLSPRRIFALAQLTFREAVRRKSPGAGHGHGKSAARSGGATNERALHPQS